MATNYLDPSADGANTAWTKSAGSAAWSLLDDAVRQPTVPTTGTDMVSTATLGALQDLVFPNTLIYSSTDTYTLFIYGQGGTRRGVSTLISTNDGLSYANEVTMIAATSPATATGWFQRNITTLITSQTALDQFRVQLKEIEVGGVKSGSVEVDAVYLQQITASTTSVGRVSLAPVLMPSARSNHSITIRGRVQSGTGTFRTALYQGVDNRSGNLETTSLTTSLQSYILNIPLAQAILISDYSNLEIRFWGYNSTGASNTFEVAEVYLTVPLTTSVQLSLPSSDILVNGWVPTSSSPPTLYDKLNEPVVDDANYISSTAT